MYQKDYILKMIEMLGKFIAAIFDRISNGKFNEAEELLDESYETLLKESAAKFTFIPKEQLTEQLLSEYHFVNEQLEILAILFKIEGDLRFAQKNFNLSADFLEKSLILLEFLDNNSKLYSMERKSNIDELKKKINLLKVAHR